MKQFLTLENELTIINELMNEMVEKKYLTQTQALKMFQKIMERSGNHSKDLLPSKQVVNQIMNYSKSLDSLKTTQKTFVLVNN